jgi:hypothetical protein
VNERAYPCEGVDKEQRQQQQQQQQQQWEEREEIFEICTCRYQHI